MLCAGMVTPPPFLRIILAAALVAGLGGCSSRGRHRPPAPPNTPIDLDEQRPAPVRPAAVEPLPPPRPLPPPPPVEEPPPPPSRRQVNTGCGPGAGERFSVQSVAATDVLNVRSEPDPRATVLGELPPDATGIIGTEETARVGSSIWRKVRCQKTIGWVNERFLAPEGGAPPAQEPEPQPEPEPPKKKGGPDPKLW
jgi:hypothetical protein